MFKKITPSPLVLGNSTAELMQSTNMFRPKNDNVKELEANRAGGKVAKAKNEPPIGVVKQSSSTDIKSIQNFNKINNNAIEAQSEEMHSEKISDIKVKQAKFMASANAANAAAVASAAAIFNKQMIEKIMTHKPNSGQTASDAANKSNNNVANAIAPKNPVKESTKKKSKEKDQKAAEEKRRQLEEDEEKKRLELIAAQRRAKLVDQNATRPEQGQKRNNLAASVGK